MGHGAFLSRTKIPGTHKGSQVAGKQTTGLGQVNAMGSSALAGYFFYLAVGEYPQPKVQIKDILKIIPDGCPLAADIPAVRTGDST